MQSSFVVFVGFSLHGRGEDATVDSSPLGRRPVRETPGEDECLKLKRKGMLEDLSSVEIEGLNICGSWRMVMASPKDNLCAIIRAPQDLGMSS